MHRLSSGRCPLHTGCHISLQKCRLDPLGKVPYSVIYGMPHLCKVYISSWLGPSYSRSLARYACQCCSIKDLAPRANGFSCISWSGSLFLQHRALASHAAKRFMQTSCVTFHPVDEKRILDEKSKVESYVEHQRRKWEEKRIHQATVKLQEAFIFQPDHQLSYKTPPAQDNIANAVVKKSLKEKIMHEIKHYYDGFRLLVLDTRIAARLLWQVLHGKTLTRRERKQFLRTVADLFRLVPFMVFVIVPFMEFLLPVAIKLFPGMLPSTFEDKSKKEHQRRASLRLKLEMAEFLQDTIEEIAVTTTKKSQDRLREFSNFVNTIRLKGEQPSNLQIIEYAKLFEDEITLENLPHAQLRAICRLLMISPIGTSNFIRFRIMMKLRELKADDKLIRAEGIDSLSIEELQNACIARGMRALGVPVERMKINLKQWIELTLDSEVPASLLLLSRTLYMGPNVVSSADELKVTIQQLPERIIDEMEVKIGAVEGEEVNRQTILDIIQYEEEKIREEHAAAAKRFAELEAMKKMQEENQVKAVLIEGLPHEVAGTSREAGSTASSARLVAELKKEEFIKIQETLSTDRERLLEIKEDRDEYIEELKELGQVEKKQMNVTESVASSRLGKRIDKMLHAVDSMLSDTGLGVSRLPEGRIDQDGDGVITTSELFEAIKQLRNSPDDAKIRRLVEVLDDNKDGELDLEEIRMAVELLATEDLELNDSQVTEVLALMKGTEKIYLIEQRLKKMKTNYLIRLLPEVYCRRNAEEVIKSAATRLP